MTIKKNCKSGRRRLVFGPGASMGKGYLKNLEPCGPRGRAYSAATDANVHTNLMATPKKRTRGRNAIVGRLTLPGNG